MKRFIRSTALLAICAINAGCALLGTAQRSDRTPAVHFLEPYAPAKIPVLFVHGINGSPLSFEYLIQHLDRTRFQPWVYSYPSGARLASTADHLTQVMMSIEARYPVDRFAVVAYSMGGLVARDFLLRHSRNSQAKATLLTTISTPWAGHEAARYAPAVLEVWRDMAPGSDYLRSLFSESLPAETHHHLFFTFSRNSSSYGASGDRIVTVSSQLDEAAQKQATRIYGIDATHTGVLRNPDVASLLNQLLSSEY